MPSPSSAEQTLLDLLLSSEQIGQSLGQKIYMDRADPDTAAPFLVLMRAQTDRQQSLCEHIENPDVTFDVHVWGNTRLQAQTIAEQVTQAALQAHAFVDGQESAYSDELALHCAQLQVTID